MMPPINLDHLADHPFCATLPPTVTETLRALTTVKDLAADELIFREGGDADAFYLIVQGSVSIEATVPGHPPIALQTLHEGNSLGWSWLLAPYRWTFSARTRSPSVLYICNAEQLRQTLAQDHETGYHIFSRCIATMGDRLHAARMQMLTL